MKICRLYFNIAFLLLVLYSCSNMSNNLRLSNSVNENKESVTSTTINFDYASPIDLGKYQGIYLPIDYINGLKETYSHNKALLRFNDDASFLDIKKDHIESDSHYHDGFWIKREQIEKYDFSKANEGIIIDEKQRPYIKIGKTISNRYDIIRLYVHSMLFMGETYFSGEKEFVVYSDGNIEVEGKKYSLRLDIIFGPTDIDVYQTQEGHVIGIRADSEKVEVIRLEDNKNEFGYADSREVIDTYHIWK